MQRLIYNFVFCISNKSNLLQVVTYVGRLKYCMYIITVRRKFLTGENIDEFDEFPAIRQYFPYQNFPFS